MDSHKDIRLESTTDIHKLSPSCGFFKRIPRFLYNNSLTQEEKLARLKPEYHIWYKHWVDYRIWYKDWVKNKQLKYNKRVKAMNTGNANKEAILPVNCHVKNPENLSVTSHTNPVEKPMGGKETKTEKPASYGDVLVTKEKDVKYKEPKQEHASQKMERHNEESNKSDCIFVGHPDLDLFPALYNSVQNNIGTHRVGISLKDGNKACIVIDGKQNSKHEFVRKGGWCSCHDYNCIHFHLKEIPFEYEKGTV